MGEPVAPRAGADGDLAPPVGSGGPVQAYFGRATPR
jgi:hypothetical protein